jgi:hypothetical protein
MIKDKFIIEILDLYWIDGKRDDPNDLCLHGDVFVKISDEIVADKYSCTLSSTGLYLLKSIEKDHVIGKNANMMLPCCGHFIIPDEKEDLVEISGCPNGIDWSVLHLDEGVKIISQNNVETYVDSSEYKKIVYNFVDKVEKHYKISLPKIIPTDDFGRNGYIKFWNEWHRRRNIGFIKNVEG